MDKKELELYSSAFSLSDMEIFIFPDLMYALVLANVSSPEIWKWREDPWFDKIEKKSFTYKINRVKQYIMDHYVFNLDLDTWGLTSKEKELSRFRSFIAPEALAQSNALFGYEGDKYYFDIDIRRHFGLDKYKAEMIPYWKTETVEAMTAFKYRDSYGTGAGECVSLAALYVAALFIVGRIPLEKMFMIATPLHSQNFIAEKEGFMTNNRRIVTKNMWYNGTELSAKARRAVEHEKITIVSHCSGHIHTFYETATIKPEAYKDFEHKFREYLKTDFNFETFVNYLFSQEQYWGCFQYKHIHNGKAYYISMKAVFNAQRSSKNRFAVKETRPALLDEMEIQEFSLSPLPYKALINEFESYLDANPDLSYEDYAAYFVKENFEGFCENIPNLLIDIKSFLHIEPRLPETEHKVFVKMEPVCLHADMSREDIVEQIREGAQAGHPIYSLALYAYRDMRYIDWTPFVKAALERNPVAVEALHGLSAGEAYDRLKALDGDSIYEGSRLAQPDEVWNFQRGDGLEKAFVLADYFASLKPGFECRLRVRQEEVSLTAEAFGEFVFSSAKALDGEYEICCGEVSLLKELRKTA